MANNFIEEMASIDTKIQAIAKEINKMKIIKQDLKKKKEKLQLQCDHKYIDYISWDGHSNSHSYECKICHHEAQYVDKYDIIATEYFDF